MYGNLKKKYYKISNDTLSTILVLMSRLKSIVTYLEWLK